MIRERLAHLLFFTSFLLGRCTGDTIAKDSKCSITSLIDIACQEHETCIVANDDAVDGHCACIPNFVRISGICVSEPEPSHHEESGHALLWTFTSLILIAIVIVGIYFSNKLRLVNWIKYKLNQRYNRSYDDVMIGQDEDA